MAKNDDLRKVDLVKHGRLWKHDKRRIGQRALSGKSIRLYRAVAEEAAASTVRKGQSWATTPQLAVDFAEVLLSQTAWAVPMLFSVNVPAREFSSIKRRRALQSSRYDTPAARVRLARRLSGDMRLRDDWSVMRDYGATFLGRKRGKKLDRLEVRPNRDRYDLRPKIVGWLSNDGELWIKRRLGRRRGGIATRGGGA